MPETHKDPYTASVNPPRRAKRAVLPSEGPQPPSTSVAPRPTMPMKPYTPRPVTTVAEPSEPPPPPAKRGRKPGPLSRTAREAQRRLNHSIIEKARRTKINDALAALKRLVPLNYGQQQTIDPAVGSRDPCNDDEDDGDDSDEDADYQEGGPAKKSKTSVTTAAVKPKGKKEEKEKEFKLEILIRTVSFLEDLLKRVATLEAAASATSNAAPASLPIPPVSQTSMCLTCNGKLDKTQRQHQTKKRKRIPSPSDDGYITDNDNNDERDTPRDNTLIPAPSLRRAKIARHAAPNNPISTPSISISPSIPASPSPIASKVQSTIERERLPSISSWLHPMESVIDPQLLYQSSPSSLAASGNGGGDKGNGTSAETSGPGSNSYPSPPASTHFTPVRSAAHGQPPLLNLGPVATAAMVGSGPTSASVGASVGASASARAYSKSRTAEDESAASLLLQIASSPSFRAVRSSSFSSASSSVSVSASASMPMLDTATARRTPTSPVTSSSIATSQSRRHSQSEGWALPDPSNFMLHSGVRARVEREWGIDKGLLVQQQQQQVQTPSSLLGLNLGLGLGGRRFDER